MDIGKVLTTGAVAGSTLALLLASACGDSTEPTPLPANQTVGGETVAATSGTGGDATTTVATTGGEQTTATSGTGGDGGDCPVYEDPVPEDPEKTELDDRVYDFGEALRTASLKLTGHAPLLDDILAIKTAADDDQRRQMYETFVDDMLATPEFTNQMLGYWRNTLKVFNDPTKPVPNPSRETAVAFATRLVVEGQSMKQLFTQNSKTCPTYSTTNKVFTDGACNNGIAEGAQVGVLSNPGIHAVYFGNLAFRRNRFMQETFLCRYANNPAAEPTDTPNQDKTCYGGSGDANLSPGYNNSWPLGHITGTCNKPNLPAGQGYVNFHEYNDAVTCANCHATWNHRAPMFAKFNEVGMFVPGSFQVKVPAEGEPFAILEHWLSPGAHRILAWRYSTDGSMSIPIVGDVGLDELTQLGGIMANDTEVQSCMVKRVWNFAMSRGDIVNENTAVPNKVTEAITADFAANNYNLKEVFRTAFTSEDFVQF